MFQVSGQVAGLHYDSKLKACSMSMIYLTWLLKSLIVLAKRDRKVLSTNIHIYTQGWEGRELLMK